MKKLNKLIDELNGKIIVKDTAIDDINKATVRVVKPEKTAELNEFVYSNGNPVKEGTAYHIHYTTDLEEYYMTETNHNKDKSLLIYPKKPLTNFSTYNNLNKQNQMLLKPKTFNPTESDYAKDFVNRTFVRKTNEKQTPIFEISNSQLGVSPLYDYVQIKWYISGKKKLVQKRNSREIEEAAKTLPSIKKYLSVFQYYRSEESDETKEDILAKLGVQNVGSNIEESNDQSSQTATTDSKSTTSTGAEYDMVEFDEDY